MLAFMILKWMSVLGIINFYVFIDGTISVVCHAQNATSVGCVIVDPVADVVVATSSDRRCTNCLDHAVMLCIGQVAECQRLAANSS